MGNQERLILMKGEVGLCELSKKHIIEDKDVLTMLRYYELVNELKNVGAK